MSSDLALIHVAEGRIGAVIPLGADRVELPGSSPVSILHAPHDGWTGGGFRIASILPAEPPPEGKVIIAREIELVGDSPVEILTLADAPPPPPREPTRAQAESALFHYRLPDGSDPGYFDQYEALIQNHPYAPVRIWAKGAAIWREDHPYIWAIAVEMIPPINEAEMVKLFDAAMTFEA